MTEKVVKIYALKFFYMVSRISSHTCMHTVYVAMYVLHVCKARLTEWLTAYKVSIGKDYHAELMNNILVCIVGDILQKLQLHSYVHTLITDKYEENQSHNYVAIPNKI